MTYSVSALSGRKVAVLGAGGGIGQPLSLLLKSTPSSIKQLALYDICNMGMAVDLAHIPTPVEVKGYSGAPNLPAALENCDVVVIPAGVPRKPGMTRDDLFNINAGIVRDLASACAKYVLYSNDQRTCPNAHILVISNPVNSTVPIAYETMKQSGVANPSIFGITTLDTIRAKTFIGELKKTDPSNISVSVIGGHSGNTIVPILSTTIAKDVQKQEKETLIQRIQYGGDEVVKAKDGGGSATLSMAFAGNLFVQSFLKALDGNAGIIENAFIKIPEGSDLYPTPYFACPVELGPNGISKIHPLPKLDEDEKTMLDIAISELKANINKGIKFASI